MAENPTSQTCFITDVFQGSPCRSREASSGYANWFSLLTLLLSIWCFVSNAIVITCTGLLRSGIGSLRPGLLIVCSLAFSDLMWGATVAPIYTGFSEVSWQMYEMVETNFGNTSHDVFSYPPRDHLVLPNAAFKLDVICILDHP